jgi:hypothetical protein
VSPTLQALRLLLQRLVLWHVQGTWRYNHHQHINKLCAVSHAFHSVLAVNSSYLRLPPVVLEGMPGPVVPMSAGGWPFPAALQDCCLLPSCNNPWLTPTGPQLGIGVGGNSPEDIPFTHQILGAGRTSLGREVAVEAFENLTGIDIDSPNHTHTQSKTHWQGNEKKHSSEHQLCRCRHVHEKNKSSHASGHFVVRGYSVLWGSIRDSCPTTRQSMES